MADSLLIGISAADITPPIGVTLHGYKPRKSTTLGHPLRAEALACRSGDDAWMLVTSDTLEYFRDDVADLRRRISAATGLQAEAVMVSATHTHSGPGTVSCHDKLTGIDAAYITTLKNKLVDVASEAWISAEPGLFETATAEAPDLGHNRRVQQDDGTWANEWNDPDGKHPGYFDPTVMLIGVRRPGGLLAALVVGYGCHPVTLGPDSLAISPDYVGYLKDALESEGLCRTALFVNSGSGNINPRACIRVGREYPKKMGEALARVVSAAAGKLAPLPAGKVAGHREPWNILRTRQARSNLDRPGHKMGDTIPSEIQVLRAGDLSLVSLPGELFSEFQKMLRRASCVPQTMVVSLANDYVSYLPTDVILTQGAYEAQSPPAEGMEGMIMDHAGRAFKAVAD